MGFNRNQSAHRREIEDIYIMTKVSVEQGVIILNLYVIKKTPNMIVENKD